MDLLPSSAQDKLEREEDHGSCLRQALWHLPHFKILSRFASAPMSGKLICRKQEACDVRYGSLADMSGCMKKRPL